MASRILRPIGKGGRELELPVDGGSSIEEGNFVSQLTATGMAVHAGTAGSGAVKGIALFDQDNSAGADGAKRIRILSDQVFAAENGTSGDACSEATPLFSVVYVVDSVTVGDNNASGTRQPAGLFMGMEPDGRVRVYVGLSLPAELMLQALSAQGYCTFSVNDFRECSSGGDVGAIAANGGILASDTTPILRGDANKSQEIVWAAGNADPILCQTTLPPDLDDGAAVTLDLWVYTDNAGGGGIDAASFTVESSWDGSAAVSDTATDATPAVSIHKITATIAAGDVPTGASNVTFILTPAAHAADPTQLVGARLNYQRKLLTS